VIQQNVQNQTPKAQLHSTVLITTTYSYWLCLHKSNFGQAQYRLPDDGLHWPKHVGVTVKKCFNVNFNILYVK